LVGEGVRRVVGAKDFVIQNKKIAVVTGVTGYLGAKLAKALVARG